MIDQNWIWNYEKHSIGPTPQALRENIRFIMKNNCLDLKETSKIE
jgi:hypothetical protein